MSDNKLKSKAHNDYLSWGLDFGSYRSLIAYKHMDSNPETARYKDKECIGGVPSEFWRTADGKEYIGNDVIELDGWIIDPAGQCDCIKMKLKNKSIVIYNHTYKPEEIALKLAKKIISVSKHYLKEGDNLELTPKSIAMGVPVRFESATRGTLREVWSEAFSIPSKDVHIVSEPILAALAINHFEKKNHTRPRLTYDMGHGTFDVCVLKPNPSPDYFNPEPFIAENPDGMEIAGRFLDEVMEELIIEKLKKNPLSIKISILENKNHADRRRLRITARDVKEKLSKTNSATAIIAGAECGCQMIEITRAEFEEKIKPHIAKTVDMAYDVFTKSGLKVGDKIDILLIGGSTYIPLIEKMLKQKFHWLSEENFCFSLRERAVSLGAAIYAESIANGNTAVVAPKISYGYAVETYSSKLGKTVLDVRIPSNAHLPQTIQGAYETRFDNQESVIFNIYEVTRGQADEFLSLDQGTQTKHFIEHKFGKKVPKGTSVELTTTLSTDGILTMKVEDTGISSKPTEKTFTLANTVSEVQ